MTDDLPPPSHSLDPGGGILPPWAYSQGLSVERVAKHLDRTVDATKQKASRLGMEHPRFREPAGSQDDMATRLRVLLGEKLRPAVERHSFSDEELLRFAGKGLEVGDCNLLAGRIEEFVIAPSSLRECHLSHLTHLTHPPLSQAWSRLQGLDLFCKEVIGLDLMDHQIAMAYCCLASKRALCLAGRQSGKDYAQAALALWEAVVQPNARIVIVSGAQRQSDALMEAEEDRETKEVDDDAAYR